MTACPEDSLYRRRFGALPAHDEASLQAHLRCCEPCAAEAELSASLEAVSGPRQGDALLLARAVAGARHARLPLARRTSPWLVAAAAGFALVVVAGLASAALGLYRAAKRTTNADGAATSARAKVAVVALPPPAASAEPGMAPRPGKVALSGEPSAAPSAPLSAPTERARLSRRHATASVVEPPPSLPDLKALFAAANEARRAGRRTQAGQLYSELQRLFPDSREAQLSFVSFGRMLLDAGETAEALRQFDRYLTTAPGDVLAAEAFYGRARALTALHRDGEAQQAWSDLLARFPDSIYADVARRQLQRVLTSPN